MNPDTPSTPTKKPRLLRFRNLAIALLGALAASVGFSGGCQLATPFKGTGYSRDEGVTLAGVGDTVCVAITHALLDGDNRSAFDDHTRRVIQSLPTQDGYIGHSVRTRLLGHEVWTMTVWRDEEAMQAFVDSPVHRTAIREGMSAVRSAQFLRLDWPTASVPPSWNEIQQRLQSVETIDYSQRPAQY